MIRPAVGSQELGQQVEDGRLAGAVGADQRMDRAPPDTEVDARDRGEAAELLGQSSVRRITSVKPATLYRRRIHSPPPYPCRAAN